MGHLQLLRLRCLARRVLLHFRPLPGRPAVHCDDHSASRTDRPSMTAGEEDVLEPRAVRPFIRQMEDRLPCFSHGLWSLGPLTLTEVFHPARARYYLFRPSLLVQTGWLNQ